ncbi:mitochondrial import inner membrane translocase subunit Tim54 [Pholiota molesta]|nr:mitochondrial import inner membrane translocase subunit Tim54 [Pholiota molesta]
MADQKVDKPPSLPPRQSGVRTVLSYTGIPPSWLDKRPKLPSRNWLIFLSVTSSVIGLYVYDRRECKKIRQAYVDKVKHLSEVPIDPFETPRKVTVYGAKWPGDEEYEQGIKYFRKYVKPILVAAAIDYEMIPGKRHGDIARRVAEDIRIRRRLDKGLDQDSDAKRMLPTYKSVAEREKRELEGGVVLIGRPTFKEYMAGVCKGWTTGLAKIDPDEELSRVLENEPHFDEPEEPQDLGNFPFQVFAHFPQTSPIFSALQTRPKPSSPEPQTTDSSTPPSSIPPLPPLLLVPFTNYIGISQIPLMIWGFFNQRHKVRSGAEAGYRLVKHNTRSLDVPEFTGTFAPTTEEPQSANHGDLDFDKQAESYYKKSLNTFAEDTDKIRQKYYEALPKKLATARELARGTREPTKEEYENPPPTEVELRAERLKKERRWRDDVAGWEMIKPTNNVQWDERLRSALKIFVDPEDDEDTGSS